MCHPVSPSGEPSPANKSSLVAEMRRFSISSISAYSTPSVNSTLNEAGRYFTVTFLSLFQFLVLFQVQEETRWLPGGKASAEAEEDSWWFVAGGQSRNQADQKWIGLVGDWKGWQNGSIEGSSWIWWIIQKVDQTSCEEVKETKEEYSRWCPNSTPIFLLWWRYLQGEDQEEEKYCEEKKVNLELLIPFYDQ